MLESAARSQFGRIAALPDSRIDLAEAALWIAAEEYPGLDVGTYLARLADLADAADARLRGARGAFERVERLNEFLYREVGFAGNRDDYYDARNSFLNEVLERRTGIPITLAIVYVWIARRIGVPAHGVGFPGHFLVRCDGPDEILIDPFTGAIVTRDDCDSRLRAAAGAEVPFDPRLLEPTPARQILARQMSVRDTEKLMGARRESPRAPARDPHRHALERELTAALKTRVRIRPRGRGGTIEIEYYSNEELQGLSDRLQRRAEL